MIDMDFLNSIKGCQVVEYDNVKRFKGQVEGKNRYIYGFLFLLLLEMLLLVGLFLTLLYSLITGIDLLSIELHLGIFFISTVFLFGLTTYYKNHSFIITRYTIRMDERISEESKERIHQRFYVKNADYLDNGKRSTDLFFVFPKKVF